MSIENICISVVAIVATTCVGAVWIVAAMVDGVEKRKK